MDVVIVDYGMGNLRSVHKAFRRIGCDAEVSPDPARVATADRLVLPGVGHFGRGMEQLRATGLEAALTARVIDGGVPVLGICLGVQLFTGTSEEAECDGLGWIPGKTVRFDLEDPGLRVPHIGWNTIALASKDSFLGDEFDGNSFYFVHSYHLAQCDPGDVLATAEYGVEFPAAIHRENIYGTQFHPEKSHQRGLSLLEHFLRAA